MKVIGFKRIVVVYWSDLSGGNTTPISMGFRAQARNAIILNESELNITPIEKVLD